MPKREDDQLAKLIRKNVAKLKPPKEDAQMLTIDRAGQVRVLQVNADDPSRTYLDARRGTR